MSHDDIRQIADTYHEWLGVGAPLVGAHSDGAPKNGASKNGAPARDAPTYTDIPGFCCSVPISRVAELDYDEKCWENNRQIKTLAKLRDNLLPKLMSGEVRVAHA